MKQRFKVLASPHIGYCFGVKRAMGIIEQGLKERGENIYIIGEIIHNPQAVERLKKLGAKSVEDIRDIESGSTLVIRAHGVNPSIIREAKQKGIELLDATCPFVHRSQSYVKELSERSYDIIIIGDKEHPEVKGIAGHARGQVFIIKDLDDAKEMGRVDKAGLVIQTTFSPDKAQAIIKEVKKHVGELKVYDTICQATIARREATLELAKKVDLMIIVGGRNSSNTRRLYQMCKDVGVTSRFIERTEEIDPAWFEGVSKVGISTGTSTPEWVIEEVIARLEEIAAE